MLRTWEKESLPRGSPRKEVTLPRRRKLHISNIFRDNSSQKTTEDIWKKMLVAILYQNRKEISKSKVKYTIVSKMSSESICCQFLTNWKKFSTSKKRSRPSLEVQLVIMSKAGFPVWQPHHESDTKQEKLARRTRETSCISLCNCFCKSEPILKIKIYWKKKKRNIWPLNDIIKGIKIQPKNGIIICKTYIIKGLYLKFK